MTNTVSGLDCRPNLKRENRSETGRGRCSVSENTCINEQENGNMGDNPLTGFEVDKSTLKYIGKDLQRPECILAESDGILWSADARGGVGRIHPDGKPGHRELPVQYLWRGERCLRAAKPSGTGPGG